MKTNQNLLRKMGEFDVTQRTSDGMFNATELMKQWNAANGSKKEIKHFLEENKNTQEFINALISEESLNGRNSAYLKTRGVRGGTWMHPYLFIKFAMWINPKFEVRVIKFVYDELIRYRNEAGDAYREMSEAVAKISKKGEIPQNIAKVAEAINFIAQNGHEKMLRNKADEAQMKEYVRIEKDIIMLVNKNFIKTFESLMEYLRSEWRIKYQPALFNGR